MSCVYQNKNNLMIFTGGKFPQKELALKVLENLGFTKDSSFVISADSGFSVATDYEFKTDLLIGDMDSIDKSLFSKIDDDICQKKFPKDKTEWYFKSPYRQNGTKTPEIRKIYLKRIYIATIKTKRQSL